MGRNIYNMQRWNFPNGVEAVDGKNIVMQKPKNPELHCRNYKGTDSIILLGMISPEYKFLYANVGMKRRNFDEGNRSGNQIKNALQNNTLHLPEPRVFPRPFPDVCIGDNASPSSM